MNQIQQEHEDTTGLSRSGTSSELILLGQMSERLRIMEAALAQKPAARASIAESVLDFLKVVLSGWPALGLVFLALFYVPLRGALNAIPPKVQSAQQINFGGMSLISAIQTEAARSGFESLADTIPSLSPAAVEFLLHSGSSPEILLNYTQDTQGRATTILFPSLSTLNILQELQSKGLIALQIPQLTPPRMIPTDVAGVKAFIAQFKEAHPGKEATNHGPPGSDSVGWDLAEPMRGVLGITCTKTVLGTRAVDIIFSSVAAALAPKSR